MYSKSFYTVYIFHLKLYCSFLKVLDAAALDFQLNRLNMYTMAHTFKDYRFLSRVVRSNSVYLLQRKSHGHIKFTSIAAKL